MAFICRSARRSRVRRTRNEFGYGFDSSRHRPKSLDHMASHVIPACDILKPFRLLRCRAGVPSCFARRRFLCRGFARALLASDCGKRIGWTHQLVKQGELRNARDWQFLNVANAPFNDLRGRDFNICAFISGRPIILLLRGKARLSGRKKGRAQAAFLSRLQLGRRAAKRGFGQRRHQGRQGRPVARRCRRCLATRASERSSRSEGPRP